LPGGGVRLDPFGGRTQGADAILDVTRRGDLVLDLFLGSGTTLMAAERTGRRFRGLDIDPAYVDVAIKRWSARTGLKPRPEEPAS
jgi:DNA modification methylase